MHRLLRAAFPYLAYLSLAGCAPGDDSREARIVEALTRADEPLLRSRPALVAGKYARMASDGVSFMRGSVALAVRDWLDARGDAEGSRFAVTSPRVPSLGDAHPENFGILWSFTADAGFDGLASFEPNDFDAAERLPYLVDVRRLAGSLAFVVGETNAGDEGARRLAIERTDTIIAAAVEAYATTIRALASDQAVAPIDLASPVLADLVRRASRDRGPGATLGERTVVRAGARTLVRGAPDPSEPTQALADMPPLLRARVHELVDAYARTLPLALPAGYLSVKDAAREFGAGVASWPRVRLLLLVEGPTASPDDDVILEAKELADAPWPAAFPPLSTASTNQERVAWAAHRAFSSSAVEPLWQRASWLGIEWQIRRETEAQKSVRVERLVGPLGTPEALEALARALGQRVAYVHAGGSGTRETAALTAIAAAIGSSTLPFVEEQVRVARASAVRLREDLAHFRNALASRGPTLGFSSVTTEALPIDFAALLGTPPSP